LALDYLAFDGDYEFAAGLLGFGVGGRLGFFVEDDLDYAGAVADVQKRRLPRSRRRWTQPITMALLPASEARRAPQ